MSESPSTDSSDDHNAYERSRESKKKRKAAKLKHKDNCCDHSHNPTEPSPGQDPSHPEGHPPASS